MRPSKIECGLCVAAINRRRRLGSVVSYVPNFRDHVAELAAGPRAHRVDPIRQQRVRLEVLTGAPHVQRHRRGARGRVPRDVRPPGGPTPPFRRRPLLALLQRARRHLAPPPAADVGRHRRFGRLHLGCNQALTDR